MSSQLELSILKAVCFPFGTGQFNHTYSLEPGLGLLFMEVGSSSAGVGTGRHHAGGTLWLASWDAQHQWGCPDAPAKGSVLIPGEALPVFPLTCHLIEAADRRWAAFPREGHPPQAITWFPVLYS